MNPRFAAPSKDQGIDGADGPAGGGAGGSAFAEGVDPLAGGSKGVRVSILDSRPLVAQGLASMLQTWAAVDVVMVNGDDSEGIEALAQSSSDVVVLGVHHGTAPAVVALVRNVIDASRAHVVALVSSSDVELVSLILAAGAAAVVATKADYDDLGRAILSVQARGSSAPTAELTAVVRHLIAGPDRVTLDRPRLSSRELDVLRALVEGAQTTQIARDLDLSTNTIRTHVQNVLRKLGAHSRLEATAIALKEGLLA
jgi:DNA-binding NarL/FixJ family response regulator